MARLAGITYRDMIRKLRKAGFQFDRHAKGSHEIWWNPDTRRRTTVANHPGTLPEGTVRAIIKQAGITVEEFLKV